jgi:predicted nucleic acid-binding protein
MLQAVFVDTNILVYAHDKDAGAKHERANELVTELWEQQTGIVSTQVLQEFYVTVTTKLPKPVKPNRARGIVRAYSRWRLETNGIDAILLASEVQEKHRISFRDGLIIAAAARSGAERLLTEDLNDGQLIEGVLISNPFAR